MSNEESSVVSTLTRSVVVAGSAEQAWTVLADFGHLADWVPLIGHSCLLSDQASGVGAVRRVQLARQTLVEEVTVWDEPSMLRYSIVGLPPMVGATTNTWTLQPAGKVTEVTLTTRIATGRNPIKRFVAGKVFERMALASDAMLAGLAARVAAAPTPSSSEAQS